MNVATLILKLQKMTCPDDEVFLVLVDTEDGESSSGVFDGTVVGTGSGAETGRCEIYGLLCIRGMRLTVQCVVDGNP